MIEEVLGSSQRLMRRAIRESSKVPWFMKRYRPLEASRSNSNILVKAPSPIFSFQPYGCRNTTGDFQEVALCSPKGALLFAYDVTRQRMKKVLKVYDVAIERQ